jgi:cytochrome P450
VSSRLNSNVWKLAFWAVAHALYTSNIAAMIRAEVATATEESTTLMDLSNRLEHSDGLIAYYNEVTRFVTSSLTVRKVAADTHINGKILRAGAQVMLPYRQLLMEEEVFGPDVAQLNPLRFLDNKLLARSANFKPFGSGRNMCPGRFLARKEVLLFTALVLTRFEAESADTSATFPRMNFGKPILGPLEPVSGDDLILNVRPLQSAQAHAEL